MTVNHDVVGSSPTGGVNEHMRKEQLALFSFSLSMPLHCFRIRVLLYLELDSFLFCGIINR